MTIQSEIYEGWLEAQARGLTMRQYAAEIGRKRGTIKAQIFKERKRRETGGEMAPPPVVDSGDGKRAGQKTAQQWQGESVEMHERGDEQELESKSRRIKTLEQLLEACSVDLDLWFVDHWVANKWEVGAKHPETGEIIVEPLYQVKAWLKRQRVFPQEFAVQPVQVLVTMGAAGQKPARAERTRLELSVFDLHFGFRRDFRTGCLTPFHDRQTLDIVLQVARALQPDTITIGGDGLDFAELSDKFARTPDLYFVVQPALIEMAWWLGRLRQAAPGAKIDYLQGNHDERLERAMIAHTPWAYGLTPGDDPGGLPVLSLPNLLGFERLVITYIDEYPRNELWRGHGLRIIHGDIARKPPGATARAVVEEAPANTLFGHIHRLESATELRRMREGDDPVMALCPGGMMRVDGEVPGHRPASQHWQQGFALSWYGDGWSNPQAVSIWHGRCRVNGELYEGRDYVSELRGDVDGEWGL